MTSAIIRARKSGEIDTIEAAALGSTPTSGCC